MRAWSSPVQCHGSNSFSHLLFTMATLAIHGLPNWSTGLQTGDVWQVGTTGRIEYDNDSLFICSALGTTICITSLQPAAGVWRGLL